MRKTFTKISLIITFLTFSYSILYAQTANVSGKVYDENKNPLGYVTVQLEGTTKGAMADGNGNYLLSGISPGEYKLAVSYVGYKKFTATIVVGSTDITADVNMEKETNALKNIVVIGYGSVQKKDLTGSIVSISSKDFNQGNITTPEQLVSGKVAGVQITPNGGAPGSGSCRPTARPGPSFCAAAGS